MLERLAIANFQAHRALRVVFDPRCTVFVGPTDAGKSAILRALRWAMLNDAPRGITTVGQTETTVTLWLDGGRKVTRRRTEKLNAYRIDNAEPYRAVGQDVPEPIAKILNVDALNFQRQLDGPFWIEATAGHVSRELNQIINLGIIDNTLAALASKTREAAARLAAADARVTATREQARALRWVKDAEERWAVVEAAYKASADATNAATALGAVLSQRSVAAKKAAGAAAVAAAASRAVGSGHAAATAEKHWLAACRAIAELKAAKKKARTPPPWEQVFDAAGAALRARDRFNSLNNTLKQLKEAQAAAEDAAAGARLAEDALAEEFPNACPTCGKPL